MYNAFAVLATATYCNSGEPTTYNKAYALHSLSLVRATPNRGDKAAATSHIADFPCQKLDISTATSLNSNIVQNADYLPMNSRNITYIINPVV